MRVVSDQLFRADGAIGEVCHDTSGTVGDVFLDNGNIKPSITYGVDETIDGLIDILLGMI